MLIAIFFLFSFSFFFFSFFFFFFIGVLLQVYRLLIIRGGHSSQILEVFIYISAKRLFLTENFGVSHQLKIKYYQHIEINILQPIFSNHPFPRMYLSTKPLWFYQFSSLIFLSTLPSSALLIWDKQFQFKINFSAEQKTIGSQVQIQLYLNASLFA